MVKGGIDLDVSVRVCSQCPKLYIAVAVVISTAVVVFDPGIAHHSRTCCHKTTVNCSGQQFIAISSQWWEMWSLECEHYLKYIDGTFPFSALTLLVGRQDEHPACKNFTDEMPDRGATDLHMVQLMPLPSCHLLLHQNRDWFNFLVLDYQVVLEKRPLASCLSL